MSEIFKLSFSIIEKFVKEENPLDFRSYYHGFVMVLTARYSFLIA